jgi:hypothetical protein
MDTGNWIALAAAAASWVIPLVNTWFKDWLDRRRGSQEGKQSESRLRHRRRRSNTIDVTPIISLFGISSSIIFFVRELDNPDPVTRHAMFNMALYAGTIIYHMVALLIAGLQRQINTISNSMDMMIEIHEADQKQISQLTKIIEVLQDSSKKDFDEA